MKNKKHKTVEFCLITLKCKLLQDSSFIVIYIHMFTEFSSLVVNTSRNPSDLT